MKEKTLAQRVLTALSVAPNGMTARQLSELLVVPLYDATQCVNGLRAGNKVERRAKCVERGEQVYGLRTAQRPTDSRLPVLKPGPGERRDDCRGYAGCLGRWCAGEERGEGHCAPDCRHYVPLTRAEKLHEGMIGGVHPLSGGAG